MLFLLYLYLHCKWTVGPYAFNKCNVCMYKVKAFDFNVCNKGPQNKLITIATSPGLPRFIIPIPVSVSTNTEMLVKFDPLLAEIFGKICRFLRTRPKSYRNSLHNLWVSGPITIKLA